MTNITTSGLCGPVSYRAHFESVKIDVASSPMDYDMAGLTFGFYSESLDLVGTRSFTVQAYLQDYSSIKSPIETGFIEIVDRCLNPFSITDPG